MNNIPVVTYNFYREKIVACRSIIDALALNDSDSQNLLKETIKNIESIPALKDFFSEIINLSTRLFEITLTTRSEEVKKIQDKCRQLLSSLTNNHPIK